ncbi:MAG: ComEC/Rec2 family competence protein [Clostridia bacterium]|nr:ComEC/Rec2 family competence protein [Clostridia bacterium]
MILLIAVTFALKFTGAVVSVTAAVLVLFLSVITAVGRRLRLTPYRRFTLIVCFVLALLFFFRAVLYYSHRDNTIKLMTDGEKRISGTVKTRKYQTGFSSGFIAEIRLPDGGKAPACIEFDFLAELSPGQSFELISPTVTVDEDDAYLSGEGIYLSLAVSDSFSLITGSIDEERVRTGVLRDRLCGILYGKIGGEEAALASAMLLGEKNGLSDKTRENFSRAGISHILSVSGMHMSVLCAAASFFLSVIPIPRQPRMIIMSVLVIMYTGLLGFPVSALRSALMIISGYAVFFLGTGRDGPSSLGIAVTVILFVWPYSVKDLSFILTTMSTLGIVTLGSYFAGIKRNGELERNVRRRKDKLNGNKREIKRARKVLSILLRPAVMISDYMVPALITAFAANVFTMLPVSIYFGEYSLMSPLSGSLLTFPAYALLILSSLTLLFSRSVFLSGFFGLYSAKTADVLLRAANEISEIRNVTVSLKYEWVPYILIPATLVTLILISVRLPVKYRILCTAPALISVILYSTLLGAELNEKKEASVYFVTDNGSDAFAVCKNGVCVIGDISTGAVSAASKALELAKAEGATEVEVLIFSHLHVRHNSSLYKILSKEKVRRVWFPRPSDSKEAEILSGLIMTAGMFDTECVIYERQKSCTVFGNLFITVSPGLPVARSGHPAMWIEIRGAENGQGLLYLGESAWEADFSSLVKKAPGSIIICGSHGPVAKPFYSTYDNGSRFSYFPAYLGRALAVSDIELLRYFVPPGGEALEMTEKMPVTSFNGVYKTRIR